ncbi:MAG: VOC family protein [Clostridium sp.]|uniref:VOC family protein n=1 Tax=Clostridium sp. TaxID=1506 RepID=UPI00306425B8
MSFCWSTLTVKDMELSLNFYQEVVGLTLDKRYNAGPGVEIAFLGDSDTKIELISNEAIKEINVGTDISWGFQVDSVEEKMKFLKEKGIDILSGPFKPNPHISFFFILDPNGLKIQFVENIK